MRTQQLEEDYALVLQQIYEDGSDDMGDLVDTLYYDRSRMAHIIEALQHKGLVIIHNHGFGNPWLSVSAKGKRLMTYLWPESGISPAF